MLRESMLIVPKADNTGRDLSALRDAIAGNLTDKFGGVTLRDAIGAWRDNAGALFREPVTELVAAAPVSDDSDAFLRSQAEQICRDGQQHAAYVRYPSGNVEIVSLH